jgi:hypothetical protein
VKELTVDDLEIDSGLVWALPLGARSMRWFSSSSNERKSGVSGGVNNLLNKNSDVQK